MQNDLPLAPPVPVDVRATSREVFEQIKKDGTINGARIRALEILVDAAESGHGPLTGAELDAWDQSSRSRHSFRGHLHKRLPELRRIGVVVEGDSRKCKITGRKATTWTVSGRLPQDRGERRVTQRERIKDLERENARLARRVRELEADLARLRQQPIAPAIGFLFTEKPQG